MINRKRVNIDIPLRRLVIKDNDPYTKDELVESIEKIHNELVGSGYVGILYRISRRREDAIEAYHSRPETDLEYNDRIQYELEREDDRRYQYNELKKEFENE